MVDKNNMAKLVGAVVVFIVVVVVAALVVIKVVLNGVVAAVVVRTSMNSGCLLSFAIVTIPAIQVATNTTNQKTIL